VDAWRAQMRENFFISDPLPPLKAQTHRRFQPAAGVRAEAVTYGTQFGLRVPSIVYFPDPMPKTANGKVPAFIVVNGHGGDKFSWYAFYTGILYARAGAVVLTYDPTGEGERNAKRLSGTRAHDNIKGDAVLARRQAGLMITDVMQAVSYLSQRPEVDAQRIGAGGYSLGSFVVTLAGAIEPRLRVCVPVGGGNLDGPGEYWDKSKPMCQGLPYQSLNFLGDRAAVIYAMHAARGPTLIFNGRQDTVVNIPNTQDPFFEDLRARVTKLRGSADGVFDFEIVDGSSHRPYFITRPVALWLEKQLDFPNWTAGQIKTLRETRISDWAAQHSIPMDKLYATEQREGGTPALLDDVPGYQRDDLAVFTAEEWQQQRDTLIIDSWLAKARAMQP
jgi:dienelactone hydrolase